LATLTVAGGSFTVPTAPIVAGSSRRLRVHAGDVSIAREKPLPSTITNVLPARVLAVVASGEHEITALLGLGGEAGARLLARVTRRSWDVLALSDGIEVYAQVKAVALVRGWQRSEA
jgi:molybdate transport system ATP-binding protein